MNMERTLHSLHKEAEHMAFSWYIRKGYVPPVLHKIQDASFKLLNLLPFLQAKTAAFDFVGTIASGKTLLVGEGNFSFSLALTKKKGIDPANITATTDHLKSELAPEGMSNAQKLKETGAGVLFGVDATNLSASLGALKFDNIVFQFPHVGSREPVEGHNPNYILVRDFLKSASYQLMQNGQVLISAVDNPHYRGAFQFDIAAEKASFLPPEAYPFDPEDFVGYTHSMTHLDGSALDNHDAFSTWVFKLK